MNLFNNTKIAFSLKSDSELERAFFLFKLIQSQPMVKIGKAVTQLCLHNLRYSSRWDHS